MEDLSAAVGVIAVLLEVLRQRGEVSGEGAPVAVEIVQVQRIRTSSCEQGIPAGRTQRLLKQNGRIYYSYLFLTLFIYELTSSVREFDPHLTVGPRKDMAPLGKLIQIGVLASGSP